MYRKSMPENQGMLFIFPYPSIIKMWMKNTYIPLDMIFFNAGGEVICLHENARPLDKSIISCPYPASKVLELNAGEIKAKKIQLGDTLFMSFWVHKDEESDGILYFVLNDNLIFQFLYSFSPPYKKNHLRC